MTLTDLLSDENVRRQEFPVCADKVFLAHAAVCPLPRRVAEAMRAYLAAATQDNQEGIVPESLVQETRQLAGRLMDVDADEIAFVGSTSMGLAMVAAGLPWQRGDNVICYRDDYPANVYPWMNLEKRGVEVRFVEPAQYGNVTVTDLEPLVDHSTRLVALASAHFVSGWRLDVDAIGQFLHERGVLFCLDNIQTLGSVRTSCRHVDFAAADAHKWLLGPVGTAVFFVRRKHFEMFTPPLVGWASAPCPGFIAQDTLRFWPTARRYEAGSMNTVGIVGLHAALRMLEEMGMDQIEARVLKLAELVRRGFVDRGYELVGGQAGKGAAGLVTLTHAQRDVKRLHDRLTEQKIITSLRQRRDKTRCLRVSAHFYNTETEIEFMTTQL